MSDAIGRLMAAIEAGAPANFDHADLRGADLRRAKIACSSFRHAKLDGADLGEAVLECVDLSFASLRDVVLERTHGSQVRAPRAVFAGARGRGLFLDGADLSHADLTGASLPAGFIRGVNLERASLDDADLSEGKLVSSDCSHASFKRTDLSAVLTLGCRFFEAELSTARGFFLSREVVAEVLLREVEDDFERSRLVGVVAINPKWCFREWKAWLDFHPALRAKAFEVFAKYPQSGCAKALEEGYAG